MLFPSTGLTHRQQFDFTAKYRGHSRYSLLHAGSVKNILIHGAPFVMTMDEKGRLQLLTHRSIYIREGVIKAVFDAADTGTVNLSDVDMVYDAEQRGGIVITPGLINAHAHPPMYLLRGALTLQEDNLNRALKAMAEMEGAMNDHDFFIGALGDLTEQQKSGITTTVSHYAVFDPIEAAAKLCRQRVINAVSAASNTHPQNTPALIGRYAKRAKRFFTTPAAAIHYVHRASAQRLTEIARLVNKHKLLFTLHVSENEVLVKECIDKFGKRPIEVLDQYKLLGPQTLLSHCVHLSENEIKLIKKRRAAVVHLPTSNLLHKSGLFNYPLFHKLKATDRIALGTDSVVSKNRLDLLSEALQTKTMHQSQRIVAYSELFNIITAQGARLIGRPDVGRIAPGFRADIAFWKLKDRGFLPYDEKQPQTLVANMITHGGRNIRDLMIDGQFVIANRLHTLVDESSLLEALQAAHQALRARLRR